MYYMANVNAPAFQPAAAAKGVKSDIALSMVTLNMHGFNQSSDFLTDTCNSGVYDLIHIQEHWLKVRVICISSQRSVLIILCMEY